MFYHQRLKGTNNWETFGTTPLSLSLLKRRVATSPEIPLLAPEAFGMKHRKGNNLSLFVVVFSIFLFGCFMYNEDVKSIAEFPFSSSPKPQDPENPPRETARDEAVSMSSSRTQMEIISVEDDDEEVELAPEECDLFDGEWVFDNLSHPIYEEDECEFLTAQVTCMRNGRKDSMYQNWKWQPRYCSLPKFKARLLLEKLRGKRLMFVGDSLNRNQWESMVCLVQSAVPRGRKSLNKTGSLSIFRIEENAIGTPFWSTPNAHIEERRTQEEWPHTPQVCGAHPKRGSFDEGATEYDEIDRPIAYARVLKDMELGLGQPRWDQVCFRDTTNSKHVDAVKCGHRPPTLCDLRECDRSMQVPVHFLNITTLSEYRKDAHTSVYTIRQGKMLTDEQKADPATYADCIHWCLPGLPDTWNEFLYARIISRSS
ncbi:trichome birefringence-like protein [Actinidia rufa]|uniref:Trichome birefringence-like protein n=1 Tax=Actinidia rufa TaxID=165716 RepID=A0A7J0E6J1_9ERIC|nr:trichome birefringence-like protein [Actinidia rufa]